MPRRAAAMARISVATAFRYMADPRFRAVYQQEIAAQREQIATAFVAEGITALAVMHSAMEDEDVAIRVRAAEFFLKRLVPEKLEASNREGPQQLRITEIVVQLPQAAVPEQAIQGELGGGVGSVDSRSEEVVESPSVQSPDSAWGSLEVVVAGEGE